MKKLSFFLILFPVFVYSSPRYPYPKTPDQVWQNDRDLDSDILNKNPVFPKKTLAQLKLITPTETGIGYYCTSCTNAAVCVSTGTGIFGFSSIAGKTTICN